MFEGINVIAVLGSSLFLAASAIVWYSPLMFGSMWLKELGVTEAEIETSKPATWQQLGVQILTYVIVVGVIAHLMMATAKSNLPIEYFVGFLSAIWIGTTAHIALWENRSRRHFLINAVFGFYFIVVSVLMLTYWPW